MLRQESHTRKTTDAGGAAPQFQHLSFRSGSSADREQKTLEGNLRLSRNSFAVDGQGSAVGGICEREMKLDGDWADKAVFEKLGKLMAEEKDLLLRRTAKSGDRSFAFDIGED